MTDLQRAQANFRRACSVHEKEQSKGRRDTSVRQTRRMALAVAAMQRAAFKLRDAKQADRLETLRALRASINTGALSTEEESNAHAAIRRLVRNRSCPDCGADAVLPYHTLERCGHDAHGNAVRS